MSTKMNTPYLEFRYLKNAMINLGDGQQHAIPMRMIYAPNPSPVRDPRHARKLSVGDEETQILIPYFDMEKVHKVQLQNERPIVPEKIKGMSEGYYSRLCEAAYETAAKAKIANDGIRKRVNHYVEEGIIEVIADPFVTKQIAEGEDISELAAALVANAAPTEESEEE